MVERLVAGRRAQAREGGQGGGAAAVGAGRAGREEIRELVTRVCAVMGVDPESIALEFFETPEGAESQKRHAIGRYRYAGGRNVVELDLRESGDPDLLAGVVAHELAHKRLIGERRSASGPIHDEELTDLLTVHLGMGVFTTNGARRFTRAARGWTAMPLGDLTDAMLSAERREGLSTVGYLSGTELGYALARHCLLRGDTGTSSWAAALHPGPRSALLQGLRYLRSQQAD